MQIFCLGPCPLTATDTCERSLHLPPPCPSVCLPAYPPNFVSVCLSVCLLSTYFIVCVFLFLPASAFLHVRLVSSLCAYLSPCLHICLFGCLPLCLPSYSHNSMFVYCILFHLPACLPVSFCLPACLCTSLSIHPPNSTFAWFPVVVILINVRVDVL